MVKPSVSRSRKRIALTVIPSKKGMYKDKKDLQGKPDQRMFCVANGKVGLIKLVSKEVKSEIKQRKREKKAMHAAEEYEHDKYDARP